MNHTTTTQFKESNGWKIAKITKSDTGPDKPTLAVMCYNNSIAVVSPDKFYTLEGVKTSEPLVSYYERHPGYTDIVPKYLNLIGLLVCDEKFFKECVKFENTNHHFMNLSVTDNSDKHMADFRRRYLYELADFK